MNSLKQNTTNFHLKQNSIRKIQPNVSDLNNFDQGKWLQSHCEAQQMTKKKMINKLLI